MKIKKIRLFNGYKRFRDLTIDLGDDPKKIILLVGENGTGKSSVFDGLMFVNNLHDQIGNKTQKDFSYHSMDGTPGFQHDNVEIDFTSGKFYEVFVERHKTGRQKTIFSLRSPYRYNSTLNVTQTSTVPEIRLNNYGATTLADLDDKMEQNYRRIYISYYNYLNSTNCRPSEAKDYILGQLNASITKCLNLTLTDLGNVENGKGTLYFSKPDHDRAFSFNVLSSGEREVIDILLDLYLRREEFNDTIFLIDEPELHINSSIQRKLLEQIVNLIGENCQVWIATHSIGFLRSIQQSFSEQSQILHFKESMNLAKVPTTITPSPMTAATWKEIFSIALDDLSHLVAPRRIIYCEGRDSPGPFARERGLDANVFNTIFGEKYSGTQFVSSGGNTELDQRSTIALAVLSKALPGVEIVVLKDRDMISGGVSTQSDRKLYLDNNPKNHRVLDRREIENYLFDKEILKAFSAANKTTFDEVSYDALVTDITNDNVKDAFAKIKNIAGLSVSISADRFKENLARFITPQTLVYKQLEACIFS